MNLLERMLIRWRGPRRLREYSRLSGREDQFDDLSRKHQQPMERLNALYVQARPRLRRKDRIECQRIITDAVDKALADHDRAAELLAAGAKLAEELFEWRARPRVMPLRADPLVKEDLAKAWQKYPIPVGQMNTTFLEAQLYLRGRDVETCLEMIRSAISMVDLSSDNAAEMFTAEADRAVKFMIDRAQLTARRVYATGLYLGVAISAVILTAVAFITIPIVPDVASGALQDVLVCLGGGAIGAVVSTILRVSNTDRIEFRVIMLRTAAFRIIVGWLFAAALVFLVKGDIITLFRVPTGDGTKSFFFWAAVGFLAGFNEVWVQNLVTRKDAPGEPKSADGSKEPN